MSVLLIVVYVKVDLLLFWLCFVIVYYVHVCVIVYKVYVHIIMGTSRIAE